MVPLNRNIIGIEHVDDVSVFFETANNLQKIIIFKIKFSRQKVG